MSHSGFRLLHAFDHTGKAGVFVPPNETHARAVALPLAWCLAGVLECDVIAGAVPACAQSFWMFRRAAPFSPWYRDARFFIGLIRIAHKSLALNR
jgi:hypothetical protein